MTEHTGVIDLSADRVSLPTPASVRSAAKEALEAGKTHYTDRPGVLALREAVSLKLAEVNGVHVAPNDEVLITCGAQEALFLALRVLVTRDSEVIVTGPALPDDIELVRLVGAAARVSPTGDQLELDVDEVEALVTPNTSAILLRAPSPVGHVPSEQMLERLGRIAIDNDLWVLAVESEEATVGTGAIHRSIGRVAGLAPRTVTINDFSGLGLTAWRVGYLAAQREAVALIRGLKQELSICSPAVSQYAALPAMSQLSAYEVAVRDLLDTRRSALLAELSNSGLRHNDPQSGMFVMVASGATRVPDAIQHAREAGVLVGDGDLVGAPGWLRLTLDHEPEVLAEAATRLVTALHPGSLEVSR